MKECKQCGEKFPFLMKINGKIKNLGSRIFCLKCSPYGEHNTSKLINTNCLSKSIINSLSLDDFKTLVSQSKNRSDIFLKLKMRKSGASFSILNKRLLKDNIDISHFIRGSTGKKSIYRFPDDIVYCRDSKYTHIRGRILRDKNFKYQCFICNNTGIWRDKTLTLEVDHINGDRYDNRKENLRWLCPNCHSQTITYCKRNK